MAITIPGLTLSILRQETTAQRGRPLLMSGRITALGLGLPAYIRVYLEGPSYEPEVRSFDTFAAPFSGDYSVNVISEKDGSYVVYAQAFPPPLIPTGPPFPEPILLPPPIAESPRPPLVVGSPAPGGVGALLPDGTTRFLPTPPQTPIEFRPVITVAPGITVTAPGVPAAYPRIPYVPPPAPPPAPPVAPPEVPAPPVEAAAAIVEDIRMVTPAIAPGQDAVGSITWRNTTTIPRQYHVSFYLIDQAGARYGPLQVNQFVMAAPQIPSITAIRTPTEGLPLGAYDALAEIYDAETNALVDSRSFPARLYIEEVVPLEEVPTVPTGEMLGQPQVDLPYELTVGETWTGSISLPTLAPVPLFFNTRLIVRDPRGFEIPVAEAGQTLQPGQILQIPVNFNTSGFDPGTYTILLRVFDQFGNPIWEFPLGFLSMLEAVVPAPPPPELPTAEMIGLPSITLPREVTAGDIWSGTVSVPTFAPVPYYFNAQLLLEDTQIGQVTQLVQPGQTIEFPVSLNTLGYTPGDYAILVRVFDQLGNQLIEFPMGFLRILEALVPEVPTAPTADMFGTPTINLPSQVEIGEIWQGNISIPTYAPPALMQLPSLPSLPVNIGLQLETPAGQLFNVGTFPRTFTPGQPISLPINFDTSVLPQEGIHNLVMKITDLQGNTLFSNIIGTLLAMMPAVPPVPEVPPSRFPAIVVNLPFTQVEQEQTLRVPVTYTHDGDAETVTLYAAIGEAGVTFNEFLQGKGQKIISVPRDLGVTPHQDFVDIPVGRAISPGTYDVYAKITGRRAILGIPVGETISPPVLNVVEVLPVLVLHTLEVRIDPAGAGYVTVSPEPSGGTQHNWQFPYGTTVYVTAHPNPGYVFDWWSGEMTDTPDITAPVYPMTEHRRITAHFKVEAPPAPPPPAASEITGLTVLLGPATYLPGDTINVGVWIDHQGAAESVELYAAVGIADRWFNEVYIGRQVVDLPRDDMPTGHIAYIPIQVPESPRPDTYSVYAKTVLRAPEISSDIVQNVVEIRVAEEQFTLTVGQEPVVGTVEIDPEKPTYDRLDVVALTAVIDPFLQEQYAFDYWLINGSRRDYNPASVIMMRDSEAVVYWKGI